MSVTLVMLSCMGIGANHKWRHAACARCGKAMPYSMRKKHRETMAKRIVTTCQDCKKPNVLTCVTCRACVECHDRAMPFCVELEGEHEDYAVHGITLRRIEQQHPNNTSIGR